MNKMNKNGQVSIGLIVMLFVGIIVAVALFVPIADTTAQMTKKQVATNQSNDVTSAYLTATTVNTTLVLPIYTQSTWKQADCPLESVVFRNGAHQTFVLDTDYVLDADAGTYTLKDSAGTAPQTSLNLTYVDYTFCADGYNTSQGSRSMANLVLVFSALIIFAFVIQGIRGEWFK